MYDLCITVNKLPRGQREAEPRRQTVLLERSFMLIITALRHKVFFLLERSQALYFQHGFSACSI